MRASVTAHCKQGNHSYNSRYNCTNVPCILCKTLGYTAPKCDPWNIQQHMQRMSALYRSSRPQALPDREHAIRFHHPIALRGYILTRSKRLKQIHSASRESCLSSWVRGPQAAVSSAGTSNWTLELGLPLHIWYGIARRLRGFSVVARCIDDTMTSPSRYQIEGLSRRSLFQPPLLFPSSFK